MRTKTGVRVAGTALAAMIALGGCAAGGDGTGASPTPSQTPAASSSAAGHGHAANGGPAPEGIQKATDPRFPAGTEVVLEADHMPGMKNAPATIAGAYRTTAYAVDYTPTDGGPAVKDHKWVVQEELGGAGRHALQVGDTAEMTADHMPGMKGATATVSRVGPGTVYMVDYQADGMTMKNHKWVVEDEIRPAS